MLEFFRSFFRSTLGVGVTLGLLALIALAFAAADVASSGGFGGIAGGDRVAMVGKARIGTAELAKQASQGFEVARQDNPRLSMKAFLAGGGLEGVLSQVLDRTAIVEFGKANGIIAGKRLIDSELAKLPALQGPDGKFSEAAYRSLLAQRQLTDGEVRADIQQVLVAKQVLTPAQVGASEPKSAIEQYVALLKERRTGAIGMLPAALFAPKTPPSDAELGVWYQAHQALFIRPERRVLRYARFDDSVIKALPAPSDAEIAARYQADAAKYAASSQRKVSQLIVGSESDARAILADTAKGTSFEAAAKAKGLSLAAIGPLSREALAAQGSADLAAAAFGAKQGAIAGPVKSALGWALVRVDAIEDKPARSLAQVRGEIASQLAETKRRAALSDLTAKIDDRFSHGGALTDAAKDLNLTLTQTVEITADGKVYGKGEDGVPKDLAKIVQAAFAMEREGAPQVAELVAGKSFVIYDVTRIVASAPAPLAEIKPEATAALMLEKGAAEAKAAGLRLLAQTKQGKGLPEALATLGRPLPPLQQVSMTRDQLQAQRGQVPPPLALFFSMAQGTTKLLPAPQNRGWLVVQLARIEPGKVEANDPVAMAASRELGQIVGREYADQLRRAITAEVGVKRNPVAIRAVATQLGGGNAE